MAKKVIKKDTFLKDFLMAHAERDCPSLAGVKDNYAYSEDVNPDAANGKWLERGTSYIWKIGVLAVIDSNKCDYVTVYIAHERSKPENEMHFVEVIGKLHWRDGENDDIARSLQRYMKCLAEADFIFRAEDNTDSMYYMDTEC
jgi:hypothetical protein